MTARWPLAVGLLGVVVLGSAQLRTESQPSAIAIDPSDPSVPGATSDAAELHLLEENIKRVGRALQHYAPTPPSERPAPEPARGATQTRPASSRDVESTEPGGLPDEPRPFVEPPDGPSAAMSDRHDPRPEAP
jgi:hypothetical protein